MTTKMKGLLKGLRYISQIFEKEDDEEKEEEMQIGFPTDVKHVAHIGWDGPAVSSPSWMNEFKGTPEAAANPLTAVAAAKETPPTKSPSQDFSNNTGSFQDSPTRNAPDAPKPSRRRHSKGDSSSFDSTNQEFQDAVPKQSSRRQKSSDSSESIKPSRRHKNSTSAIDPMSSQDPSSIPKQPKTKKKSRSSDGSSKSRSKGGSESSINDCPTSGFEGLGL